MAWVGSETLDLTAAYGRTTMPKTTIPLRLIEDAVLLACRAPSYHNSQPWRWVVGGGELHLFVADRLVATVGPAGRR
jgi:hypothetical protein